MLSLAGNNIESFNTDDLNSMLSLKVLSISDNPLGYECAKSLEKAANIKQISIYGCTLTPSEDMRIVTRLRNNANSICKFSNCKICCLNIIHISDIYL